MKKRLMLTGVTVGLFALNTSAQADVSQMTMEESSYTNNIGMNLNFIPAGTFIMGSPATEWGRQSGETQHQVTLTQSFYMQTTEVTNKQWNTIIVDSGLGVNPSYSHTDDHYPVENMNWFEAVYFANQLSIVEELTPCYTLNECDATVPGDDMTCGSVDINTTCTGYQLPTEAQWEYAARATTTTSYANPVDFDRDNTLGSGFNPYLHSMGWYWFNNEMGNASAVVPYEEGTKPVALKQANKWGLFDMHGNVWEWCQDWSDGTAYSADPVTNPQGDETGTYRVARGGGWINIARLARSAQRGMKVPAYNNRLFGFRLILSSGQ